MTVLLTGATGFIGSAVLQDLLSRGDAVRAVTSQPPPAHHGSSPVDWRRIDLGLAEATDMDALVDGCVAVLHVAAEKRRPERMGRVNTDATRLLAEAAERAGVPAFCYVSTISVYGSGRIPTADEEAPLLTADRDIASEYRASAGLRAYGRTKLGGELAIRAAARSTRYVILRPAVVVDLPQIVGACAWSRLRRTIAARRRTHHVYLRDVSDVIVWSMDRMLTAADQNEQVERHELVETFNVSDDGADHATYGEILRRTCTADRRTAVVALADLVEIAHELVWAWQAPRRKPLWRMRFPAARLHGAGFRPRWGMAYAASAALRSSGTTAGTDDRRGRAHT